MEVVNPFAAPITHGEIALRNRSGTLKQIQGWPQCCICVLFTKAALVDIANKLKQDSKSNDKIENALKQEKYN
jgi:hypothetical protein